MAYDGHPHSRAPGITSNGLATIPGGKPYVLSNLSSSNLISRIFQGVLVPHERRGTTAAGAVSDGRPHRAGHSATCQTDKHAESRRGGVRCDDFESHQVRVYWRQRVCEGVGHQSARLQKSRLAIGLSGK